MWPKRCFSEELLTALHLIVMKHLVLCVSVYKSRKDFHQTLDFKVTSLLRLTDLPLKMGVGETAFRDRNGLEVEHRGLF